MIFAIACQTVALIWFVATLRNDVDTNQMKIVQLETRTEDLSGMVQDQSVMIARMDENIKAIRDIIEKMARHP
jgi:hypothetical protein